MFRVRFVAASAAIFVFALGSADVAGAKSLRQTYTDLYYAVKHQHGARAPGRNIRKQGVRSNHHVRRARSKDYARSIRTFRRWLAPPVPAAMPGDRAPVGRIASAPAQAGGRWAIPASIVMCESHGNYNAVNPSSGARGAYQLMPSTYAAYGGDGSWSPADQDRVAAKVYAGGAGRGQWSC